MPSASGLRVDRYVIYGYDTLPLAILHSPNEFKKKKNRPDLGRFISGVKYGIRTHDLQGHNLAL